LAVCDAQGASCFELSFASIDDPVSAVIFPLRIPARRMMPLRSAERHKEP
jgi:hypothetical protein